METERNAITQYKPTLYTCSSIMALSNNNIEKNYERVSLNFDMGFYLKFGKRIQTQNSQTY